MTVDSIGLMLLTAARDGELTFDPAARDGIRWRGSEVDFDMANRVENLRIDDLLDWDTHTTGPVALTRDGSTALLRGVR